MDLYYTWLHELLAGQREFYVPYGFVPTKGDSRLRRLNDSLLLAFDRDPRNVAIRQMAYNLLTAKDCTSDKWLVRSRDHLEAIGSLLSNTQRNLVFVHIELYLAQLRAYCERSQREASEPVEEANAVSVPDDVWMTAPSGSSAICFV
jgi:hypothetical protein